MAHDPQVSMTPDEFATAQRMLQVLDSQIALLKRRVDRHDGAYRLGPTDRQAYFYSSDSTGLIQFHSDSNFVAEQIFVYGMPDGGRSFLSIEDGASGRSFTKSQEPNFNDFTDVTTKMDGIWIPPSAWTPTMPCMNMNPTLATGPFIAPGWNFDHVATLETELVVARGGALRFRFRHSADGSLHPNGYTPPPGGNPALNYTVTLIGYKVY